MSVPRLLPAALAMLAARLSVAGMEPLERFVLNEERPDSIAEPCSDDWRRLHWWYADAGMSCELFREQILGCADRWRARFPTATYRAQCMLLVAFGADSPKRFGYGAFGRRLGRSTYLEACPEAPDWERGLQMLRVLHGVPSRQKHVFGRSSAFRLDLRGMKRRFAPGAGACTPGTRANRDAARWAARRTRFDP